MHALLTPRRIACAIVTLTSLTALLQPLPTPRSGPPRLLAWNDLGMHCIDPDFSVFSILPPANTINAHLIVDGRLRTPGDGYTLTYEAVADASGSINSTSIGKTNFWAHAQDLFGVALPPDHGLAGFDMPGLANVPQSMAFDATWSWFHADWIPLTPIDDAGRKNPYPLMRIVARDSNGTEVASTVTVAPNSSELACKGCHASGTSPDARPPSGWVYDPDPVRDGRLNILKLHDDRHLGDPLYQGALVTAGYSSAGLLATATTHGTSVFCARCHATNAIPNTGVPGISSMTSAMHGLHADAIDSDGVRLADNPTRSSCYVCHPGFDTKCMRGAMGKAIGADGGYSMDCQSCHGDYAAIADAARVGWLDEPSCQNCHTGTATHNSGQIRYTSVFDAPGHRRVPADLTFATTPDVPAPGFSLYRFSSGHGGLQCSACHGPPHAIYPTSETNDNVQSTATQGHIGTIVDCAACHDDLEDDEQTGPHGMHPVGQRWADHKHADVAEKLGIAHCRTCHGGDDRGTVLSLALGDRTVTSQFGPRTYWRGARIGCWSCHAGPDSDHPSNNAPPAVLDRTVSTPTDVALPIALSGSDPDSDPLTLRVISQPSHGTVAFDGATATYRAAPGFVGSDAFTYAAWDGKRNSNLGTINVGVTAAQCSATATTYGFGCPGTNGEFLGLRLQGCPSPGEEITFAVDRGPPAAPVTLLLGTARTALEFPPGCVLHAGGIVAAVPLPPFANDGTSALTIRIPASASAADFALQAFALDPQPSRPWSSSNGLELLVR